MTNPRTPGEARDPGIEPVEPRIGDADRDQAVSYLQEHHAQGRLDRAEFEERMEQALQARRSSELAALFADLPEPRPGRLPTYAAPPWAVQSPEGSAAVTPRPAEVPAAAGRGALPVVTALVWPVTIVAMTVFGLWHHWWLIFIPIVVTSVLAGKRRGRR